MRQRGGGCWSFRQGFIPVVHVFYFSQLQGVITHNSAFPISEGYNVPYTPPSSLSPTPPHLTHLNQHNAPHLPSLLYI